MAVRIRMMQGRVRSALKAYAASTPSTIASTSAAAFPALLAVTFGPPIRGRARGPLFGKGEIGRQTFQT